jgi:hypothetical protein
MRISYQSACRRCLGTAQALRSTQIIRSLGQSSRPGASATFKGLFPRQYRDTMYAIVARKSPQMPNGLNGFSAFCPLNYNFRSRSIGLRGIMLNTGAEAYHPSLPR